MKHRNLIERFSVLKVENDLESIARLLSEHPELVTTPECASFLMIHAAREGNTRLVALLYEHGVDINTPHRPIVSAASANSAETVRWLLDHGSDVNWDVGNGQVYCGVLPSVIMHGNLEIVRMLVEAGAKLDILDRKKLTPLSWAIECRQTEIVEYLRAKGGIESHQAQDYRSDEKYNLILEWIEGTFGRPEPQAWLPIVPDDVPVAVRVVFDSEVAVLFTEGMSAQPMHVPAGGEQFRYAELVAYLLDWPRDPTAWLEPERLWPLTWMRRLAQRPFENDTWLGGETAIIPNGDPPVPLGLGTEMTCWLLLADREPMTRFEMPNGRSVFFYEMVPIYTAERDFAREHGTGVLLERFVENGVRDIINPNRASVI